MKKNKQKEIRNNEIIASIIKTKTELNTSIKKLRICGKGISRLLFISNKSLPGKTRLFDKTCKKKMK